MVKRSLLRYHGGKWMLAPWIISHFPRHRVYVEPYGGAANVLLQKPRSYGEIYNDLDGEVVNLFKVVRDHGAELQRVLHLTPFARSEYLCSFNSTDDPIERARQTVVRSYMGFGSDSICRKVRSGFRGASRRRGSLPPHDWESYPKSMREMIERLRGVIIENRDAIEVMLAHDGPETLHYLDPPYVHATRHRLSNHGYVHEMTDDQHRKMAAVANELEGSVIVSGYHSPLYDELFAGWERVERKAMADGARERTEVLWLRNVSMERTLFDTAKLADTKR